MKQYKISFFNDDYRKRPYYDYDRGIYYREFENDKQAKEWAEYWLNEDNLSTRYELDQIEMDEFIEKQ